MVAFDRPLKRRETLLETYVRQSVLWRGEEVLIVLLELVALFNGLLEFSVRKARYLLSLIEKCREVYQSGVKPFKLMCQLSKLRGSVPH